MPPTAYLSAAVSWNQLVWAVYTLAQDEHVSDGAFAEYDANRLEQAAKIVRERARRALEARG